MERLRGKVAIVTGAGQGIGEGIARMFAAEGAAVLVADRNTESVMEAARRIQGEGGTASAFTVDVTVSEDICRMVETAVGRFAGLDILVHNAAMTSFGRRLDQDEMEERYDRLMATNVKSVWLGIHHALPHLRARGGGGSIINIASVHGLASGGDNSAYAASKGALIAGTRAMAVELAPDLIRVNCISPGMIWKDTPGDWVERRFGPDLHREFLERFGDWAARMRTLIQPLPVAGAPKDIAYCATYLASDESRFCTGANFVIDGGATALLAGPSAQSPEDRDHEREMHAWLDEATRRHEAQE